MGPINMGNPHESTMLEVAHAVKRMTGSSSRIIHVPLPQDDPVRRKPDISRATSQLGWEPHVPLEQGLRKTIDYFIGLLSEKNSAGNDHPRSPGVETASTLGQRSSVHSDVLER